MDRKIHRVWPAMVIVALVLLGAACTRNRPQRPVDAWTPPLTRTATPTPERAVSSPSSPLTTATPTPPPATTTVTPALPAPATTPTPTGTPATPAAEGEWHYYTVKRGDTLYSIARRFGTTVEDLLRLNGMTDATIYPGQQLKVPGRAPAESGETTEYIVQPGDTLFSIAKRFGVDMQELARVNNITDPSTIYVGQRLIIPGGAVNQARQLYQVQPGDTLSGIAQRFGVSLQALMDANGINNPDEIYVGQILRIP